MSKTLDGFEPLEINHGNKGRKAWYTERIEQLEQLCKDFWNTLRFEMGSDWIEINRPRMVELGLLKGESNATVEK